MSIRPEKCKHDKWPTDFCRDCDADEQVGSEMKEGDKMNEHTTKIELELMIDKWSLTTILGLLAEICQEKAEHIRSTYQDKILPNKWEQASKAIDRVRFKTIDANL